MTRPTKHPKTGTYLVRVAIPQELRSTAKELFGVQRELRENLRTKDAAEARRRAPEALARLRAMIDRARNALAELPPEAGPRDLAALAGVWYRRRTGADEDPETQTLRWDILMALAEHAPEEPPHTEAPAAAEAAASGVLRDHGFAQTAGSVKRLAALIGQAQSTFSDLQNRRIQGDWSADDNLGKFPALSQPEAKGAHRSPGCTFDTLLAGWALDHGHKVGVKPIPRPLYDRQRTLERLASFLGHRDADRVTKADVVRWKEEALSRSLTVTTVRNDLSEMSAVWAWGLRNGKLRSSANPFEGTLPPKAVKQSRAPRAFTDEEATRILEAARSQRGFLRWLPWVLCLTGARLNEVCQSVKEDVATRDGVHVIRIHDEGEGRSVKNEDSRRTVPLHPALIAEGFLDYVAGLPSGSPLWPDVRPDAVFGLRSTTAGRKLARWLRGTLGVSDPQISPAHSWRHWFIGACRGVAMPLEVRSALTGHSAKMDESAGYGPAMGSFVRVVAEHLAKVPCPVPTRPGTASKAAQRGSSRAG